MITFLLILGILLLTNCLLILFSVNDIHKGSTRRNKKDIKPYANSRFFVENNRENTIRKAS